MPRHTFAVCPSGRGTRRHKFMCRERGKHENQRAGVCAQIGERDQDIQNIETEIGTRPFLRGMALQDPDLFLGGWRGRCLACTFALLGESCATFPGNGCGRSRGFITSWVDMCIDPERFFQISAAKVGPKRFHQVRTVSSLMSIPRSLRRSSTCRNDRGKRMSQVVVLGGLDGLGVELHFSS